MVHASALVDLSLICRVVAGVIVQPVNTFLIPDISGDGHTSPAILKAAQQAAAGMSTTELCCRALAEIGGAWALCWAINAFLTYVSKRAEQVRSVIHHCSQKVSQTRAP